MVVAAFVFTDAFFSWNLFYCEPCNKTHRAMTMTVSRLAASSKTRRWDHHCQAWSRCRGIGELVRGRWASYFPPLSRDAKPSYPRGSRLWEHIRWNTWLSSAANCHLLETLMANQDTVEVLCFHYRKLEKLVVLYWLNEYMIWNKSLNFPLQLTVLCYKDTAVLLEVPCLYDHPLSVYIHCN